MYVTMIISSLLSSMNVYVNTYQDIRFSINDLYMALLMTGWMFLFMGIYDKNKKIIMYSVLQIIILLYLIRTQLFVNEKNYILGMIPHHSMAIFLSKKLLEKKNNISNFLKKIIYNQQNEINYLKSLTIL